MDMENEGDRSLFRIPLERVGGLTDEQERVLKELMEGFDILVTGGAGTGKTYVLKQFVKRLKSNYVNVAVVAYTAQAALESGGMTINRFFGFPAEVCITKGEKPKPLQRANELIVNTDVLIIDEISMVRSDLMDSILMTVRKAEKKRGRRIQIVLFGDFYQIPPVPATNPEEMSMLSDYYGNDYKYRYAFMAKNWKSRGFRVVELKEVVRQEDLSFIDNLNKLRMGDISACEWFNTNASFDKDSKAPNFFALNEDVFDENLDKLGRIDGTPFVIRPIPVKMDEADEDSDILLDHMTLYLKDGARVMATKNYVAPGVVNGMLGTVKKISRSSDHIDKLGYRVTVKFDALGYDVDIDPVKFTITSYKASDIGLTSIEDGYYQLPLQLAYAMTIHKGQGKTCDKANVNPYCKIPGQLYVALSRVRDISGLHLTKEVKPEYIVTSADVKEFMEHCNEAGYVFSLEMSPKKSSEEEKWNTHAG